MEEIEVNGKKYVLKDEIAKPTINLSKKNMLCDYCNIVALGSFKPENYVCTDISIVFLEKAIAILKSLDLEAAVFAWAKDMPLLIGKLEDDSGEITGIAIGPRVENK